MLVHRSKKSITEGLLCPCCGAHTRRQWEQESGLPDRPTFSQTDCQNPACPSQGTTLSLSVFIARFGTASS